jgi:hypothetical protein
MLGVQPCEVQGRQVATADTKYWEMATDTRWQPKMDNINGYERRLAGLRFLQSSN